MKGLAIWTAIITASTFLGSPPNVALARREPWAEDNDDAEFTSIYNATSMRHRSGETISRSQIDLLIKYRPATLQRTQTAFQSSKKSKRLNRLADSMSNVSRRLKIARVKIDADEKDAVMWELMMDDAVEMVEEDFLVHKMPYTKSSIHYSRQEKEFNQNGNLRRDLLREKQQIGVDLIQAPLVWSTALKDPTRYNHTSIKVCIIDTGYDFGHEDLPTNDVTSTETIYGDALSDGDGHGTHCAGIIGAVGWNQKGVIGVNPDPEKFSFHISKALNAHGVGTASSLINGIEGCISSGSKIISMSVGGGPDSDIFRELYKEAYDQGILVVAAAGNDGTTAHDYPASFPHVISVGAVDQKGKRANFSNYNEQIELMAPGVMVMSTAPNDEYHSLSGTSMSTPYVAGVAALIWGFFPECSNNQIRNVLALTAKRMAPDDVCDEYTGFGLIQAKKAFDALDRWGCEAPGKDPATLSDGGIGGCGQALPDLRNPLNDVPTRQPTPKPTPKPFSGTEISKGNSCQELKLDLLTDKRAYEISWVLERVNVDDTREEIKRGPPSNMNYFPETQYSVAASDCLDTGKYEFTVYDMFGDGIEGPGYYAISLNGQTLVANSNFGLSETTSFTVDTGFLPKQSAVRPTSTPTWRMLLSEEFEDGFGDFIDEGKEVLHKNSVFGRRGVAWIQVATASGEPSLSTREIEMDQQYSLFKVVVTYRTANLEKGQKFCLEYCPNNSTAWNRAGCWRSGVHFQNQIWNDDVTSVFQVEDVVMTSIRIRLKIADGEYMDRLVIDRIKVSAMS